MENDSENESSQILGNWDFLFPVNSEGTSPQSEDARSKLNPPIEKEIETRVLEKERTSTSNVAGEGRKETGKRILPAWADPSYVWGNGLYKIDGRTLRKMKRLEKGREKRKEKESDEIPFKEIIEALLRNSGEKKEERNSEAQRCAEKLKAMGLKFPR